MNMVAESSPGSGMQRVVDVELLLDLLVGDHLLGPGHLLDLGAHGLAVLEDERHDGAHRHPAAALQLDDRCAGTRRGPRS